MEERHNKQRENHNLGQFTICAKYNCLPQRQSDRSLDRLGGTARRDLKQQNQTERKPKRHRNSERKKARVETYVFFQPL